MNRNSARFVGTAFAASVLLLTPTAMAAGPTNGATALLVGGQGPYAQLTEEQMVTAFGGYLADYDRRISVPFPGYASFTRSTREGSDNLYNAIYAHQANLGTPLTIGGVSKGAPAVVDVLYRLMADAEDAEDGKTPPRSHAMTVAIYGAVHEAFYVGVEYRPLPETPWNTMVITAEYDGIADFPDNRFNGLAVLNALAGAAIRHVDAAFYDLENNPVHYRVDTNSLGGVTTTIILPAERLPLLNSLYDSDFVDQGFVRLLEGVLRPIIDSGYKRHSPAQQDLWKEGIVPLPEPPTGDALVASSVPDEEPPASVEKPASSDDVGDDTEDLEPHREEAVAPDDADDSSDEEIADVVTPAEAAGEESAGEESANEESASEESASEESAGEPEQHPDDPSEAENQPEQQNGAGDEDS